MVRKAAGWLVLTLLALAGCDDPKTAQRGEGAARQPTGRPGEAARAVEERLQARIGATGPLMQRAVQLHRQALSDTLAICGQLNPTGRGDDAFIPYVAVANFEGERLARLDLFLAASTPEATRVYFEMVDRCWDGGGPTSPRGTLRPLPPAPSGLPRNVEGDPAPAVTRQSPAQPEAAERLVPAAPIPAPGVPGAALVPAAPPVAGGPPRGTVTTTLRSPANIRSEPSGGGSVVRVAPRGSALQVYGEAAGGWYMVGEGEPWGWVHGSMLESR